MTKNYYTDPTSLRCGANDAFRQGRAATIFADWIFGIRVRRQGKKVSRFFFLEADLDNEDVAPREFGKASILKKMLVYRESAIPYGGATKTEEVFGIRSFRTLFITTPRLSSGRIRVQSFIKAAKGITNGQGTNQFLFGCADYLKEPDALVAPLFDGQGNHASLLNPKAGRVASTLKN